ncbi:hypothetical protein AVEN_20505-1 [Araneus ventricosus]|uniref:Uncharacterized protein n=1 Tax=Araneus ventricosus TaxID=182803 RepID=A0A4Y2HXQ1_ARAVE|nr:hypothetical protein AVEN_20505-1 [Araneus ventricosus]
MRTISIGRLPIRNLPKILICLVALLLSLRIKDNIIFSSYRPPWGRLKPLEGSSPGGDRGMPLQVLVGGRRDPSADQQVEVQLLGAMVFSFSMMSQCPDTELSPNHIFDCPAILRTWQGVCFSPAEELYSDKIGQYYLIMVLSD